MNMLTRLCPPEFQWKDSEEGDTKMDISSLPLIVLDIFWVCAENKWRVSWITDRETDPLWENYLSAYSSYQKHPLMLHMSPLKRPMLQTGSWGRQCISIFSFYGIHSIGNHIVRKVISQKEHYDTAPKVPGTVLIVKHFLRSLKA